MQLRRIVNEFPKIDPTSYAFTYADTATFEEEVDEWFSYNEAEFKRLHRAKDTFERRWKKFVKLQLDEDEKEADGDSWLEASRTAQEEFVKQEVNGLLAEDLRRRCKCLQTILHILLGVWDETAGKPAGSPKGKEKAVEEEAESDITKPKTQATEPQLEQMKAGISLLAEADGIKLLFQVMQDAFKRLW
jgi:uncharacterized protein (DUF4415 family)